MTYRLNILASIFVGLVPLLFFSGCVKEPIPEPIAPQNKFEFQLDISSSSVVESRATTDASRAELYIDYGYILVYENFSAITSAPVSSLRFESSQVRKGNGDVDPIIGVPLGVREGNRVVFILNSSLASSTTEISTIHYSEIDENFRLDNGGFEKPFNGFTGTGTGLPMYGEVVWGAPTADNRVNIRRAVAKFQIMLPSDNLIVGGTDAPFTTTNVRYKIYKQATQGNVGSLFTRATPPVPIMNSVGSLAATPTNFTTTDIDTKLALSTDNAGGASYIYEHQYSRYNTSSDSRLAIILKHTHFGYDKFYRLDLCTQDKDVAGGVATYLDIERNHHYKINITKVGNIGYDTAQEAFENPASNIEYNIVDDSGDHTASNGQYAITSENLYDGLIYRSEVNSTTIEVAKLKYVAHNGSELSPLPKMIVTHSSPTGIAVTSNLGDLTPNFQGLNLTITGEGKGAVTTTIKFGNLTFVKTLEVDKGNNALDAHTTNLKVVGQVKNETNGGDSGFTIKNTADNKINIWTPENVTPTQWKLMNPAGDYVVVADGSNYDAIPCFEDKFSNVDISTKDGGIIKVVIDQLAPIYIGRYGSPEDDVENAEVGGHASLYTNTAEAPLRKRAIIEVREEKKAKWGTTLMSGENQNIANDGLYISMYRDASGSHGALTTDRGALNECYKKNIGYVGTQLADDLVKWYLPAQQQLAGVWTVLTDVNNHNAYPFSSGFYWSATEDFSTYSWFVYFNNGNVYYDSKTSSYSVRCVRDL